MEEEEDENWIEAKECQAKNGWMEQEEEVSKFLRASGYNFLMIRGDSWLVWKMVGKYCRNPACVTSWVQESRNPRATFPLNTKMTEEQLEPITLTVLDLLSSWMCRTSWSWVDDDVHRMTGINFIKKGEQKGVKIMARRGEGRYIHDPYDGITFPSMMSQMVMFP